MSDRVRDSFARQAFMSTLGAELRAVDAGRVEIVLPFRESLTQQHGYVHAGAIATILDSACGYAALSVMAGDTSVLTVEYKINLVAPAVGHEFIACGRVVRAGRTLLVCAAEAVARQGDAETVIAIMQATIMSLPARTGREN